MKKIHICIVITTQVDGSKVYVSDFSVNKMSDVPGRVLVPEFTSDPQQALDFYNERSAGIAADAILDYKGRIFKVEPLHKLF